MSDLNLVLLAVNLILTFILVISFFLVGVQDDKENK